MSVCSLQKALSLEANYEHDLQFRGLGRMHLMVLIIVAFLQNATIEYSSEAVCIHVCFCMITQKVIDLGT